MVAVSMGVFSLDTRRMLNTPVEIHSLTFTIIDTVSRINSFAVEARMARCASHRSPPTTPAERRLLVA
jgi:hypothetical protein